MKIRIVKLLIAFALLSVSVSAWAQTVEPPAALDTCVPITDCNGDGVDDEDPELLPQSCSNPDHVCIDNGTCRPKADGYCRVDAECETPKICDRNLCKAPAPGPEDGAAINPLQGIADALNDVGGAPQGSCPYGYYKNSSNQCVFGCATDADCGYRSLPSDRRCRLIPNHTTCVVHLNLCATVGECELKCKAVFATDGEGNVSSTSYEWKGQGIRDVRCIPKVAPPACAAANEGATIEGLLTRY